MSSGIPSRSLAGSKTLASLMSLMLFAAACTDPAASVGDAGDASTSTTSAPADDVDAASDSEAEPASGASADGTASGPTAPDLAAGEFNAPGSFGDAPPIPADYDPGLDAALDVVFGEGLVTASFAAADRASLQAIEDSGDPRMAWYMADLIRFFGATHSSLLVTAESLTGLTLSPASPWGDLTDHLIAWDVPAPPGYAHYKRALFSEVEPQWGQFFEDDFTGRTTEVDYRVWSWGGVGIDDRPFGQTDAPCNCIPAADDPLVTDAAGGDWYDDDRIVFGVEINGEARAYPRNIMEIREMVNDTLGGRDFAMPYCTLCGSAQVYFTDEINGEPLPADIARPVMRTSGLLTRSNKVMYDVNTFSVFDTFLGTAVTGPLADAGVQLDQASVVTTTWGEWKAAHPDTTILSEFLALGRDSDFLSGRDADGPIFPVGEVDPRLPVQEFVLGVTTGSGTPVAFPADEARRHLQEGGTITFEDITVELFAGGVRAVDADGNDVGGHQAFWFAWSQFHPDTQIWTP